MVSGVGGDQIKFLLQLPLVGLGGEKKRRRKGKENFSHLYNTFLASGFTGLPAVCCLLWISGDGYRWQIPIHPSFQSPTTWKDWEDRRKGDSFFASIIIILHHQHTRKVESKVATSLFHAWFVSWNTHRSMGRISGMDGWMDGGGQAKDGEGGRYLLELERWECFRRFGSVVAAGAQMDKR